MEVANINHKGPLFPHQPEVLLCIIPGPPPQFLCMSLYACSRSQIVVLDCKTVHGSHI